MDNFKTTMIQEWSKLGFSFFKETIWSSSIKHMDLPKIRCFLEHNNIKNVDVSIVIPQNNDTPRMRWNKHYDISGQCISSIREEFIPEKSNNLKLTFCYRSKQDEKKNESQVVFTVNILRMIFGVPVARELVVIRHFSNDNKEPNRHSDTGFASMFDTQSLNMFDTPPIEQSKLIKVPVEATILLDKAFLQTYPAERFILMWLAFETIISSFPGDGENGKKRKKYFKDELNSNIINNEIRRLFKLRCDIFKEGKIADLSIEKDCWSLYAAIQLTIMKSCEQRLAFINGYEKKLV